jgi:hypothetical protein
MPIAERRLAELWLASRMRSLIRVAANKIDFALARHPQDCGESREAGRRIMFEWPLGALVEVDDTRLEVRVLSVWKI